MLKIEVITDLDRLAAVVPEWDALDQKQTPRTPFTSPLWCLTWWRHFQRNDVKAADQLRVYLLRDERGQLVSLAPMFVTNRPGRGPIRTRELQFFGADPYVTELRGPICVPERASEAISALARHLETESTYDWVQWRGLRSAACVEPERGMFRSEATLGTINYFLRMPDQWETLKASLPRNIKESLRKCYNSLAREGYTFTLKVVERADEVPSALDRFFDLHRTRAETQGTIDHNNVFENTQARTFLHDYCKAAAERGTMRIFQLMIKDDVIATRIGFSLGDELYLYFSGYDVAWGRFSVMTTTVAETIKWAISQQYRIVNLSTGTDVSKTRWRPEQISYEGGYTVSRSPIGKLAFAVFHRLRHGKAEQHITAEPQVTK